MKNLIFLFIAFLITSSSAIFGQNESNAPSYNFSLNVGPFGQWHNGIDYFGIRYNMDFNFPKGTIPFALSLNYSKAHEVALLQSNKFEQIGLGTHYEIYNSNKTRISNRFLVGFEAIRIQSRLRTGECAGYGTFGLCITEYESSTKYHAGIPLTHILNFNVSKKVGITMRSHIGVNTNKSVQGGIAFGINF